MGGQARLVYVKDKPQHPHHLKAMTWGPRKTVAGGGGGEDAHKNVTKSRTVPQTNNADSRCTQT